MIRIDVEDNPNCPMSGEIIFSPIEEARPIRSILTWVEGQDRLCEVVAVEQDGIFGTARAQKVADSGEGTCYLIFGGKWGIRLRSDQYSNEPWALLNTHQWGESHKLYGSAEDILFADSPDPV